jgi:hypothetical protein
VAWPVPPYQEVIEPKFESVRWPVERRRYGTKAFVTLSVPKTLVLKQRKSSSGLHGISSMPRRRVKHLRCLLHSADENISRDVDNMGDAPKFVVGFFCYLLDVWES